MFGGLDARALFVLLRKLRPQRMIEVGSGYSSLLSADVNQRFLDSQMELTCVEPHPPKFLDRTVSGLTQLIRQRVQDLPITEFQQLANGDILFIDSSHVAKTGSDVNFLILEVLPRLQPGTWTPSSSSPTASPCWSMAAPSPVGHAGRDPRQRRRARRPISARRRLMLRVRELEAFYGASQALFGMELGVDAGEVVTLMGRNGMGKTTTVNTIMGLCRRDAASSSSTASASITCRPIASPGWDWAWCPRAARSSPTSRCARTWLPPRPTGWATPRPGPWPAPSTSCRGSPSASATWATSSRAASSRCWRSAAR